jgi:hypothetical protein
MEAIVWELAAAMSARSRKHAMQKMNDRSIILPLRKEGQKKSITSVECIHEISREVDSAIHLWSMGCCIAERAPPAIALGTKVRTPYHGVGGDG